jgi:hypothetical protein
MWRRWIGIRGRFAMRICAKSENNCAQKSPIFQGPFILIGGESGIRTHGGRKPTAVFKTAALNRSAISPDLGCAGALAACEGA